MHSGNTVNSHKHQCESSRAYSKSHVNNLYNLGFLSDRAAWFMRTTKC